MIARPILQNEIAAAKLQSYEFSGCHIQKLDSIDNALSCVGFINGVVAISFGKTINVTPVATRKDVIILTANKNIAQVSASEEIISAQPKHHIFLQQIGH